MAVCIERGINFLFKVPMMKKIGVWLFGLALCAQLCMASDQGGETFKEISYRVDILEGHRGNLDERFKIKLEELEHRGDLKVRELELDYREMKIRLNAEYRFFKQALYALGAIGLSGFVGLFFWLKKRAQEIAERKVNEKFEALFNEDSNKLREMIDALDEENGWKKRSICVVSESETDDAFLHLFFEKMGFKNTHYRADGDDLGRLSCDLVVLNDEEEKIPMPRLMEIARSLQGDAFCFYFGKQRIPIEDEGHDLQRRFAFANSRSQLYGNIINAFRSQRLWE